ncbi:MAG: penicillin-insensitive murein endopeptidase [Myxococcales bacterium]
MSRRLGFEIAMVMLVLVGGAWGGVPMTASAKRAPAQAEAPSLPKPLRKSRSLGFAWRGKLERGVLLKPGAHLRYVSEYAKTDHFYGTWQLVQLLERAAFQVSQRVPGSKLSVGELSAASGGNLPGHASHESGRDVDVGFFMLDGGARPVEAFAFAQFDSRGRGLSPNVGMRFDVRRNWELVARLVSDGEARVQYVFVAPAIRQLLLDEGRRVRAPAAVLERAARVMVRPSEKHLHGNHFHVRIYCAPGERPKCQDAPPYWPWYPGEVTAQTQNKSG